MHKLNDVCLSMTISKYPKALEKLRLTWQSRAIVSTSYLAFSFRFFSWPSSTGMILTAIIRPDCRPNGSRSKPFKLMIYYRSMPFLFRTGMVFGPVFQGALAKEEGSVRARALGTILSQAHPFGHNPAPTTFHLLTISSRREIISEWRLYVL